MSTFTGFSEADLQLIKSKETRPSNAFSEPTLFVDHPNMIKPANFGYLSKNKQFQLKNSTTLKHISDEPFDEKLFDKCRLSIKTPTTQNSLDHKNSETISQQDQNDNISVIETNNEDNEWDHSEIKEVGDSYSRNIIRKDSLDVTPDIVRGVDLTEDELAPHRAKLEELQLKQRLMEEQNKKRKEMLSKALADRTRQTEEEVLKLEKIKKELQVLDGQFSQDVNVLRKKIDQACLTYSEAEKQYLRVEKEFLQAKIQLQKEKEKKELLTEHLCALITHNETRKAQKLETLMLELASDKKIDVNEVNTPADVPPPVIDDVNDEKPIIVDGVDQRTGKMVEITPES